MGSEWSRMTEKQREARRIYHRKWRAEHPEKVGAIQQRFYEKLANQESEATGDECTNRERDI